MNDFILRMFTSVQNFGYRTDEERGQTLAEYGLMISVIAVAVVVLAVIAFRGSIIGAFGSASKCIEEATKVTPVC